MSLSHNLLGSVHALDPGGSDADTQACGLTSTTVGRMHAFPLSLMRVMLGMATKDAGMMSPAVLGLGAAAGGAVHTCTGDDRVC